MHDGLSRHGRSRLHRGGLEKGGRLYERTRSCKDRYAGRLGREVGLRGPSSGGI